MTKGLVDGVRRENPNFRPKVIFDVGANVGQSARVFLESFPEARIQCFEPVSATFEALSRSLASESRVSVNLLALDQHEHEARFLAVKRSAGNRLLRRDERFPETEMVKAMRGDRFCEENAIREVDILKIDAEGSDLRVLVGFARSLQEKMISYIQVECTTNPDNHFHVQLTSFINYLNPFGYRLFGLFEFTRQIYRTKQKLNGIWFCNAVFVREVDDPRLRPERIN